MNYYRAIQAISVASSVVMPTAQVYRASGEVESTKTCSKDLTSDLAWEKARCPSLQLKGTCLAGHPNFQEEECPPGSSCFDCDPCQKHNFDCNSCAQSGCFYCPGDGLCISQAVGDSFFSQFEDFDSMPQPQCTKESDWTTSCNAPNPNNQFSDPAFQYQNWAFDLLNVKPVWEQGITGQGVMVRVNDPDGVDASHKEFAGRFVREASCDDHLPPDMAPTPWDGMPGSRHGTTVASLAVGGGNNDECAVGIAPGASLSACTMKNFQMGEQFFAHGLGTTHVSVNSWGLDACSAISTQEGGHRQLIGECPFSLDVEENPCGTCASGLTAECEEKIREYCGKYSYLDVAGCSEALDIFSDCHFNQLSDEGREALSRGVTWGRNGKGIIYTLAAGNEHLILEDVNFEGWLNTRYTIVVAAVGKDGKHAIYSSTGAAVFVSGPGGDTENYVNNVAALAGGGCYSATVGTSFATPQVSGAIALLLEAAPGLGWRDVQGLLATTSKKTDPDHSTWVTNGAGLHHSDYYGFGLMDTAAAVEAARDWTNYGPEKQILEDSGEVNLPIADVRTSAVTSMLHVNQPSDFYTESVVIYLQVEHQSRGNLEVTLVSPSGTQSVLTAGGYRESTQLSREQRWKLMTVKNWGEDPNGVWVLTVRDTKEGSYKAAGECVDAYFWAIDSEGMYGCEKMLANGDLCFSESSPGAPRASDACCACGGGGVAPLENKLVSWTMVVYGHDNMEGPSTVSVGKLDANKAAKSNRVSIPAEDFTADSSAANKTLPLLLTITFAGLMSCLTLFG